MIFFLSFMYSMCLDALYGMFDSLSVTLDTISVKLDTMFVKFDTMSVKPDIMSSHFPEPKLFTKQLVCINRHHFRTSQSHVETAQQNV